ncbi:SDR family oxidoreductase [Sodalis sp. RH15]|uniref:SDR family oxidoreductase n=1 Tax=Sodalis sp. RH15 TaxID=3394330 RepID=UPI0039B5AD1F
MNFSDNDAHSLSPSDVHGRGATSSDILIIGADRGLGLGLTQTFLNRGWRVFATALPDAGLDALNSLAAGHPGKLTLGEIDVTRPQHIQPLLSHIEKRRFDVIFLVAGIYGPLHQSVMQATDAEFLQVMITNAFGPARLARHLVPTLKPKGAMAFMSSHRGSIEKNVEPGLGLELYRASKAALNMLARGIYADIREQGYSVLSIHPGWVATAMGTLDGAVEAEIDVNTSVNGMAEVIDRYRHSGQHHYLDYLGNRWPW